MIAVRWMLALVLLLPAAGMVRAVEPLPLLPADRDAKFLGVDTCGSSECHGSPEPWRNATVMMKERLIWETHDAHAKTYASLDSAAGRAIATKLGLGDATRAEQCLVCHTTFVAPARRGPRFRLEAGVGCESCHGPGGGFLRAHVQVTSTHAGNVAAGMYPTTDPQARAALCLSCHQGDSVRRISHRLYGAGHPRLRFELDTYGVNQPYHFNPDADYRRRKPAASHFRIWAAGQLHAARALLATLGNPALTPAGIWPELAHYDCHACHQAIRDEADHRPRPGLAPGQPALLDAPLVVLRALAAVVDPALAEPLRNGTRDLQASVARPASRGAALTALAGTVHSLEAALRARREQPGDGAAAARALAALVDEARPLPFIAAEAAAMSLSTLLTAEHEVGRLDDASHARIEAALDGIYSTLGDERTYRPSALATAVAGLESALR